LSFAIRAATSAALAAMQANYWPAIMRSVSLSPAFGVCTETHGLALPDQACAAAADLTTGKSITVPAMWLK
jgi:hypothetical protein